MQCFNHPEVSATAICKHCSKGICRQCLVDTGSGMSCRGACEEEIRIVRDMIRRSKVVQDRASAIYLRAAFLYTALALVFFGIIFYFADTIPKEVKYMFGGGGSVFLIGAVLNMVNARKMKKLN